MRMWEGEEEAGGREEGFSSSCLAVGATILVHDPTSFCTERLEHFVVVAMLR